MALFTAETYNYDNACALIKALAVVGIDANITTGGVAIHVTPDQVNQAESICGHFKASFKAGYSAHEEDAMLHGGSFDHVERVTNNAQSIKQEWK